MLQLIVISANMYFYFRVFMLLTFITIFANSSKFFTLALGIHSTVLTGVASFQVSKGGAINNQSWFHSGCVAELGESFGNMQCWLMDCGFCP